MNEELVLLKLELLEKQSRSLFYKASFESYLKSSSAIEKRYLLKKVERKAEALLNHLKNINYLFQYHSYDNLNIIEYSNTLQSNLKNMIRFSTLRIPSLPAFILVSYQIKSFQSTLSKVINYAENQMN